MRTIQIAESELDESTRSRFQPVGFTSGKRQVLVRLLGPVRVAEYDGVEIPLPSRRQRALVAILAIHSGKTLRPEYLAELTGLTPGALRTSVSRLRRSLGSDVVLTESGGYRLDADVDIRHFFDLVGNGTGPADGEHVDRFERLSRALDLWGGEALDEFRHDTWAQPEVARLDELRAGAVEDRVTELIARSSHSEAIAVLEPHIALHPLRDRARGLLMRALASDGRQVDALRAYQSYRSLLISECGTEPSTDVQTLERRIARGGPTKAAFSTAPSPSNRSEGTVVNVKRFCPGPSAAHAKRGRRVHSLGCVGTRTGGIRWWRAVPWGSGI